MPEKPRRALIPEGPELTKAEIDKFKIDKFKRTTPQTPKKNKGLLRTLGVTAMAAGSFFHEGAMPKAVSADWGRTMGDVSQTAENIGRIVVDVQDAKTRSKAEQNRRDTEKESIAAGERADRRREETNRQKDIIREAGDKGWTDAEVKTVEGKTEIKISGQGTTPNERLSAQEQKHQKDLELARQAHELKMKTAANTEKLRTAGIPDKK